MYSTGQWICLFRHGTSSVDNLSDLEESRVKSVLFDSLEKFIAGQEDVQSVFSSLTESDTPPAVCGHVFKPGGKIFWWGEYCYFASSCRNLLQLPWLWPRCYLRALCSVLYQKRAQATQVSISDLLVTPVIGHWPMHMIFNWPKSTLWTRYWMSTSNGGEHTSDQ